MTNFLPEIQSGLTQVKVAKKYNVTRQWVSLWLKTHNYKYIRPKKLKVINKKERVRAERKLIVCPICKKVFIRKLSSIKRNKQSFCSRKCLGKFIGNTFGLGKQYSEFNVKDNLGDNERYNLRYNLRDNLRDNLGTKLKDTLEDNLWYNLRKDICKD